MIDTLLSLRRNVPPMFQVILKHSLQNLLEISETCFLGTVYIVICLACPNLHPHNGVFSVSNTTPYRVTRRQKVDNQNHLLRCRCTICLAICDEYSNNTKYLYSTGENDRNFVQNEVMQYDE